MQQVEYSVVVPVYNSESTLKELFDRISKVFEQLDKSYEVIFVEDGGQDASWDVLDELKARFPDKITAIKLNKNYGQHNAIICGFQFANGGHIITIDDDLQNPPEEIKKLIEASETENPDVIYGLYSKKQHSRIRNIGSASVKKTSKLLLKGIGKGSSFRLIKKDLVEKLLEHQNHFMFIDEVLLWYTEDFSFVLVDHHKRASGKSGYSRKKLFNMISDLVYFYTNIPLKLMVWGGIIVSLISFLLGIQFILRKLLYDIPLGYTSLIVTILFSTSIIVFSLGIIGGYLSRIYMVQNKKPPFSIQKVLE
ncbi:MAG: glycosyltransferase family 2 protein [Bacteroidota bacterium]|nr:glycosyltransferase family 2 protein [Bacteroidota bacterium]